MPQRRLKDILGDLSAVRRRVAEVLAAEFPDISVNVRDIHPNFSLEKCKIEVVFDLKARIADLEEIEHRLGVDLHRPAGPYDFAYREKKGGYVLRDRRDNKLYRAKEGFILENFTRGVKQ